jgi:hypothetical protein
MSLERTGTIAFRAGHEHPYWLTNKRTYRLASPTHSGINLEVVKHADRTLQITLRGTARSDTSFRHLVPHGTVDSLRGSVEFRVKEPTRFLHLIVTHWPVNAHLMPVT